MLLILEDLGGRLGVVEQLVDFLDLLPLHRLFALDPAQQAGRCQQLQGVPGETGGEKKNTQKVLSALSAPGGVAAGPGGAPPYRGPPFIPEGGLGSNLGQVRKSFLADRDPFDLSADLDDLHRAVRW